MDEQPPRRTTLTPIGDELVPHEVAPGRASLLDRWRHWRHRREPPATLRGAVLRAMVRLVVTGLVGSGVAVGAAHLFHRKMSFGLYFVGAVLMGSAVAASTGRASSVRERYTENGPAKRMASSIAMAAAGLVIVVLGALAESAGN